jgi:hypothetical protein
MQSVAHDLQSALNVAERLRQIPDAEASIRSAPGKWSKKEILGHLIDSAANNHQRFVRLQLSPRLDFPGYEQDQWVHVQRYQERPWSQVIDLWEIYNIQVASIIRHVDSKVLDHVWHRPDGKDVNLEFLIRDYVVHLKHHLDQILPK